MLQKLFHRFTDDVFTPVSEKSASTPPSAPKQYDLAYIRQFENATDTRNVGSHKVRHDVNLKKWRLTVQLDQAGICYLSVFIKDDSTFDKFCLDVELASDSHYEFQDQTGLRKMLYKNGDENLLLHEILIRYTKENDVTSLLNLTMPFVTAAFHFD